MRKVTLFVLIAVCAVVLLNTESCEARRGPPNSEASTDSEGSEGKNPGRGRGVGRGENKEGKGPSGHHHHRNNKNNGPPKPKDESEPVTEPAKEK